MGKRKEESVLTPGSQKRQRKEYTDVHSDESDEETLEFSANSSAPSQLPDGEVGIIESIQLKNFMCHSNLGPFQFGSNLNFVVGTNGSGKSSVLTALIVGLGGKATATNRGSSLKMFIQKGETSADISITLRNQGRDAFKPELYGTSITVNQRINQDGSRTCKLKSKSGTIISSKKEELIGILDHFNIQVDNPVSVLTQEMSKQFLQTKNEGDKYKFFMKATQLEQMKEDYSFIEKTKKNTRIQIEQGEERLEELKQLYLEKKEIFKSIAFVNDMQSRLEDLKHQMAWAVVSEMEKEIELLKEGVKAEEGNTELLQKVEECQVKVNEAEKKYKAIQDKLITVSEEAQALHPQCISLKAEVQAKRKTVNETEIIYNRSKTELKRLEKDSEQLHKRIEELKSCANQGSEPEKLERQRRIAYLREQLKAFHNEEIMIGQQLDQFQQAISKCREEHSRLRRESSEVQQALDAQQKQLRDLKDSKTNTLKRFGPHVPAFLEAIEVAHKQGHFRKKPLGPLGALIHPKDPELILAIESCLKGLLQAFCCDNHSDERTLQLLMSKYYTRGHRPQIIVNKFQNRIYDTSQRAVYHPEFPSVLTALEIDNPVVANCLIDMRGIETVLLIKNSRRAREVMQCNRPPRNCKEAFTAEGDQVFERRYYSSNSVRPQLLSQDVEAEISHLDKEIENKRAQLTASQQRLYSIENEIRQNEDHLYGHRRHQKQLQVKVRTANAEIADLENVEEHQSADIHILQEEAEENKGRMESVKQDMQLQSRKMEELKNTLQAAEKKFEEVKEKIHQVEEIAGPIKAELNQAESEVENSKHRLQHYEDKQREHVACINKHKELLVSKEKELKEKMAKARQIFSEPIKVSRTVKSLDAEMNRLREKINLESRHRGNREEIIQQFHYAKERYEDASNKVKNLRRFIAMLDEVMTERLKVYRQFLRRLSIQCKLHFELLLRVRGCSGHIIFDHKNETLSITVQPREEEKAARSDLRSLSGGERSFSTVCFILSLWNISESPFRCMDEFDVYMDMVSRRIAIDMILERADFQRHRQFILFTPLSMSSLPTSPHIRILRMPDPPRDQRTLNFQNRNDGDEDQ
ncbi:structural maintenance of chromosomes protein 6 isoform X1 [Vidua chalybeata]|uniref:structural maintenance of chromosomes protein 6 isoform X1 n=2 Tax=Vidua chalybeata TaxID=81927 RepID=UPI0023A87F36|nr:structural maintenance of chromosomes protein 6 isoform X1 [Vidua chalybeata]XP_053793289.1 structural maintenance of chromosomes protein 6 isoform X1 [Vidua chalybeata]XP_053793290.1 structural maintenance of chromosomes protein 6 isoform X1 [Vidua chalybeata]XP_053793291.1 structural maintenance of chromosomes protein 6 isoform X1 [Vidua chalybeata]XP_053793292.1 structural maintenance of chromosomes protein 6 isoform X1 [Vidua chalybeata]XP_053793293.1 structural maintenance of chromosom